MSDWLGVGVSEVKLLNMMLKIEHKKIKVACGLKRDIKGATIFTFVRLLTHPLKKNIAAILV